MKRMRFTLIQETMNELTKDDNQTITFYDIIYDNKFVTLT